MKEDDCTVFAHSRIIRCLRVQDLLLNAVRGEVEGG
jgi:hypothetical protein